MPIDRVVPSVGFCFYFPGRRDHEEWLKDMGELYEFHRPNSVLEFDEEMAKKIYL